MSTPVIESSSPVPPTLVAATATKTRKPTLPDKYGKFIQFAYYMMDSILNEDFQMDKEAYLEKIKFFGSVEEQQILVQGFLTNAKENNKTIKKIIAARTKEIANAKKRYLQALDKLNKSIQISPLDEFEKSIQISPVKQARTKKSAVTATIDEAEPPKRTRKPPTKKTIQTDETELLNDLVQELTLEPVQEPEKVVVVQESAKKPKRTSSPAAKKSKPPPPPEEDYLAAMTNELLPETFVSEPEQPTAVTKPKRKTTKKESTNATVDAAILTDLTSIPNTDIEITPITFSGVTYFTDKDSQLYAYPVPNAKSIGKYVAETQEVFLN